MTLFLYDLASDIESQIGDPIGQTQKHSLASLIEEELWTF